MDDNAGGVNCYSLRMDDNGSHIFGLSPLSVALIGIVSAAAVLTAYHFVVPRWCSPSEINITDRQQQQQPQNSMPNFESLGNSITELIPTYRYTKDIGLVEKSEDVTCAVCLCEFKDGEAIRALPECLHSFHVPCIDMWLYSRSNCPLCRTDTGILTPVSLQTIANTMRLPDPNQPLEAI